MIVPDSSAWIEYLRGTGSAVHLELRRLLEERAPIATTEGVVLELLAGESPRRADELRVELFRFPMLRLRPVADYLEAAALARACREGGETVRSIVDCLIAIPAIRAEAAVLHVNRDFDVIARHSSLRIHRSGRGR